MIRRIGVVTAFALATAFAPWLMTPAAAASCSFGSGQVDVTLGGGGSDSLNIGPANAIELNGGQCGAADTSNTDTVVVAGGAGSNELTILDPASFAPGLTAEGSGQSEIEISANFNAGTDSMILVGTSGGDTFVADANGVDANNDGDDDVLYTSAKLTLRGLGGNDKLTGGPGNDLLIGGIADDDYVGGAGTDTADLSGGAGLNVNLQSGTGTGEGNDTFAGVEDVIGSPTNDSLTGDGQPNALQGAGGDDALTGGAGNDDLQGGTGTDAADFTSAVTASLFAGTASGEGADTLTNIENLEGSPGADTLVGDLGPNTLTGRDGDDTLIGRDGNDLFQGGNGSNTADFSTLAGPVKVLLGTGQATGQGVDTLGAIQRVIGSGQNDTLVGDGANNTLQGGGGDDAISGSTGDDDLQGGTGTDTADYAGLNTGITLSLQTGHATKASGNDQLTGFERVTGTKQNDSLTGSGGPDVLDGRAGADHVNGGTGNDTLVGGTGDDAFDGGTGVDTVSYGGSKKAVVVSLLAGTSKGEGADTLTGVESVVGSAKDDALRGSNLNDTLLGAGGNDTFTGLRGNDTLGGGTGRDMVNYGAAAGVKVNLPKGTAKGEGNDKLSGIENVLGNSRKDVLLGDAHANVLTGNNGNDVIRGGGGNDKLSGVSGNDRIAGGPGDDSLRGGDDNDSLDGGPGIDTCAQNKGSGPRKSCERPKHGRVTSPEIWAVAHAWVRTLV